VDRLEAIGESVVPAIGWYIGECIIRHAANSL
jgi:hypothetical protein